MAFCSAANKETQQIKDPFSAKALSVPGQRASIARAVEFAADLLVNRSTFHCHGITVSQ